MFLAGPWPLPRPQSRARTDRPDVRLRPSQSADIMPAGWPSTSIPTSISPRSLSIPPRPGPLRTCGKARFSRPRHGSRQHQKNARSFLKDLGFFFESSTTTLAAMPTRSLARPVVLLLSNGLARAYSQLNPNFPSLPVPGSDLRLRLTRVVHSPEDRGDPAIQASRCSDRSLVTLGAIVAAISSSDVTNIDSGTV